MKSSSDEAGRGADDEGDAPLAFAAGADPLLAGAAARGVEGVGFVDGADSGRSSEAPFATPTSPCTAGSAVGALGSAAGGAPDGNCTSGPWPRAPSA